MLFELLPIPFDLSVLYLFWKCPTSNRVFIYIYRDSLVGQVAFAAPTFAISYHFFLKRPITGKGRGGFQRPTVWGSMWFWIRLEDWTG